MKNKRAVMLDTTLNSLVRIRLFNTSPAEVVANKEEKLYWEVLYVWNNIISGKNGRRIKEMTARRIKEKVILTVHDSRSSRKQLTDYARSLYGSYATK